MGWKGAGLRVLRWFLWTLIVWIAVRGIVSLTPAAPVTAPEPEPMIVVERPAEELDGLRAFPAMFAREYLTWQSRQSQERMLRLDPFLANELDRFVGWKPGREGGGQTVEGVWVHAIKREAEDRWLVTVAARVTPYQDAVERDAFGTTRTVRKAAATQTLYLAVPVGKTREGGLVVYDYPTLMPAPRMGEFKGGIIKGEILPAQGEKARTLLTGFFRAYLSGRDGDLAYYLEPGVRLYSIKTHLTFEDVAKAYVFKTTDGLVVQADVVMIEPTTGSRFTYRYTLRLNERDDRWYIKDLIQKGE